MLRILRPLIALLGLTLLMVNGASAAATASTENRASGSVAGAEQRIGRNAPLSEEAVRENPVPRYDDASDSSVAAEGAVAGTDAAVSEGTTLYRVFGGEARGLGQSWTTVDPGTLSDYRAVAGLFPGNSGQFVIEGTLTDTTGVTFRAALPGPGGLGGGLPEVLVPNAGSQICIVCVSGVNPPF